MSTRLQLQATLQLPHSDVMIMRGVGTMGLVMALHSRNGGDVVSVDGELIAEILAGVLTDCFAWLRIVALRGNPLSFRLPFSFLAAVLAHLITAFHLLVDITHVPFDFCVRSRQR
jgi:hypothetical protein